MKQSSPRSTKAHLPITAAGFTLVELLVVIGIIALLMSILLPVLGKATSLAASIKCRSQLRELGMAWQMYANSHRGIVLPATLDGTSNVWWAGDDPDTVAVERDWRFGLLYPYIKSMEIRRCPGFAKQFENDPTGFDQLGYGYNYEYLSPTPNAFITPTRARYTKITQIKHNTTKVVFADAARTSTSVPYAVQPSGYLQRTNTQVAAGIGRPCFVGRHDQTGNVLWADGHVAAERPVWIRPIYRGNALWTPAFFKPFQIGDLDLDLDPNTDDCFDPLF